MGGERINAKWVVATLIVAGGVLTIMAFVILTGWRW